MIDDSEVPCIAISLAGFRCVQAGRLPLQNIPPHAPTARTRKPSSTSAYPPAHTPSPAHIFTLARSPPLSKSLSSKCEKSALKVQESEATQPVSARAKAVGACGGHGLLLLTSARRSTTFWWTIATNRPCSTSLLLSSVPLARPAIHYRALPAAGYNANEPTRPPLHLIVCPCCTTFVPAHY
jgi:hypothetical protein